MALAQPSTEARSSSPSPPAPRGPLSAAVLSALAGPPRPVAWPPVGGVDPLTDDDLQLALYACYELHYRGFDGVDDGWEWAPSLLELRACLEQAFLAALIARIGPPGEAVDIKAELAAIVEGAIGPSLSAHMAERGTLGQLREFAVHRSAYQLKEADPHTWALPRLTGRAKAAMVTIQVDEYGGGVETAMHAHLFADTMACLGLDPGYGAYLDLLPGVTLATVNLATLFGLHRRWRGAAVGHLTLFEMTSVVPMTRYAASCRRLGLPLAASHFYDVHVTADAEHQVVAVEDLAQGFVEAEPDRAGDVAFGAKAVMALEDSFARHLLSSWGSGHSSLRRPLLAPPR